MDRIDALLDRWGKWVATYRPGEVQAITLDYAKGSGRAYDGDDQIAELIDRAIAAMPLCMAKVQVAIKTRYMFHHGMFSGARYMNTSESYFRDFIRQGHAWVYGYLMAHCPYNTGEIFDLINDDPDRVVHQKKNI